MKDLRSSEPARGATVARMPGVILALGACMLGCPNRTASTPAPSLEGGSAVSPEAGAPSPGRSASPARSAPGASSSALTAPLPSPTRTCPADLHKKSDAALDAMVAGDDPCAMGELGSRLMKGRKPETYRRGAELLKRAELAGVKTFRCDVFYDGIGMAPDHALAAACLERGGQWDELAVQVIAGDGVPRDLDRAEALLRRKDSEDCTTTTIRELLANERSSASGKAYSYCEDGACTTPEVASCASRKRTLQLWRALQREEALVQAWGPAERAHYERLVAALAKYEDDDVDQHYYVYIDGTYRSIAAVGRQSGIESEFDKLVDQVLVRRNVAPATAAQLTRARQELAEGEKRMLDSESQATIAFRPAEHRKRWTVAKASWTRYRDAWLELAGAILHGDDSTRNGVEVLVTRARIETMNTGTPD